MGKHQGIIEQQQNEEGETFKEAWENCLYFVSQQDQSWRNGLLCLENHFERKKDLLDDDELWKEEDR